MNEAAMKDYDYRVCVYRDPAVPSDYFSEILIDQGWRQMTPIPYKHTEDGFFVEGLEIQDIEEIVDIFSAMRGRYKNFASSIGETEIEYRRWESEKWEDAIYLLVADDLQELKEL